MLLLFILLSFNQSYSSQDFKQSVQEHQVNCNNCPDYIASVVTVGPLGRSFCKGVLVEPNLVLTNAHCVLEYQNDCKQGLAVKVGEQVLSCENIEYIGYTENQPNTTEDIAFIRLSEESNTQSAPLNFEPFNNNQDLYYYRNTYDFSKNTSNMERVYCQSKMYSSVGNFVTKRSKIVSIKGCSFDFGDSGSPIFNSSGEVVAILQGGLARQGLQQLGNLKLRSDPTKSYMDLLADNFNYSESDKIEFHPVIIATSITCLEALGAIPCLETKYQGYVSNILNNIINNFNKEIQRLNKKSDIIWETFSLKNVDEILAEKHPAEHSQEDFTNTLKTVAKCKKTDVQNLYQPVFQIKTSVDAYFGLHFEPRLTFKKNNSSKMHIKYCN